MKNFPVRPGVPISAAKKKRLESLEKRGNASGKRPPPSSALPYNTSRKRRSSPSKPTNHASNAGDMTHAKDEPHAVYRSLPANVIVEHIPKGSLATVIQDLMSTNPRTSNARAITSGRLRDRTLMLDNPAVQREQGKRSGGGVNLTNHLATKNLQKRKGLYSLTDLRKRRGNNKEDMQEQPSITYNSMLAIHTKWKEYIDALILPTQSLKELQEVLYNANLHGCLLSIIDASEERHKGVAGIVIKDTKNTFQLITAENRILVVPKRHSVFEYSIDQRRSVRLLGSGMVDGVSMAKKKK